MNVTMASIPTSRGPRTRAIALSDPRRCGNRAGDAICTNVASNARDRVSSLLRTTLRLSSGCDA